MEKFSLIKIPEQLIWSRPPEPRLPAIEEEVVVVDKTGKADFAYIKSVTFYKNHVVFLWWNREEEVVFPVAYMPIPKYEQV